jgi:hypothetical protein
MARRIEDELAQFASISRIPQSLLVTLTTPGQYDVMPWMGRGTEGIYYGTLSITPLSPGASVPAPVPGAVSVLGLAAIGLLVKRSPVWARLFG